MATAAYPYDWLLKHSWSGRVRLRAFAVSLDLDRPRLKDAVWLCVPSGNGGLRVHNTGTGQFTPRFD